MIITDVLVIILHRYACSCAVLLNKNEVKQLAKDYQVIYTTV